MNVLQNVVSSWIFVLMFYLFYVLTSIKAVMRVRENIVLLEQSHSTFNVGFIIKASLGNL